MYPPLVLQNGDSFPMMMLAIHLMAISSNSRFDHVIVTIMNLRAPSMTLLRRVSSIAGFVYATAQLLLPYIIWKSIYTRAPAGNRAWQGARELEWMLSSPPPPHSWSTPPSIEQGVASAVH